MNSTPLSPSYTLAIRTDAGLLIQLTGGFLARMLDGLGYHVLASLDPQSNELVEQYRITISRSPIPGHHLAIDGLVCLTGLPGHRDWTLAEHALAVYDDQLPLATIPKSPSVSVLPMSLLARQSGVGPMAMPMVLAGLIAKAWHLDQGRIREGLRMMPGFLDIDSTNYATAVESGRLLHSPLIDDMQSRLALAVVPSELDICVDGATAVWLAAYSAGVTAYAGALSRNWIGLSMAGQTGSGLTMTYANHPTQVLNLGIGVAAGGGLPLVELSAAMLHTAGQSIRAAKVAELGLVGLVVLEAAETDFLSTQMMVGGSLEGQAVLLAGSVGQLYEMVVEATALAIKRQCPVFIVVAAELLSHVSSLRAGHWHTTRPEMSASPSAPGVLFDDLASLSTLTPTKVASALLTVIEGSVEDELVLVCGGRLSGACRMVARLWQEKGRSVNVVQLRYLQPLSGQLLAGLVGAGGQLVFIEGPDSSGLAERLAQATNIVVKHVLYFDTNHIYPDFISSALAKELHYE